MVCAHGFSVFASIRSTWSYLQNIHTRIVPENLVKNQYENLVDQIRYLEKAGYTVLESIGHTKILELENRHCEDAEERKAVRERLKDWLHVQEIQEENIASSLIHAYRAQFDILFLHAYNNAPQSTRTGPRPFIRKAADEGKVACPFHQYNREWLYY